VIEALRTPEERFAELPDFPYHPNWYEWDGLRLHYLDEGEGPAVVLFHGEPTWSFLYRNVIPHLVQAGFRTIAPDYFGFGKSDKPTDPDAYTFDRHTAAMKALLTDIGVTDCGAVVQDWGGPIGLRLAVESPGMFGRLSILNTGLFTGVEISEGFMAWRQFVEKTDDLPIGFIMERSMAGSWGAEVIAGYEAPYPDVTYKVGAHRFPLIVPMSPEDDGASTMLAVRRALGEWTQPVQVLFSTGDPTFSTRVGEQLAELIPGASMLETVEDAGHFLQEDQPHEVGRRIAAFLQESK